MKSEWTDVAEQVHKETAEQPLKDWLVLITKGTGSSNKTDDHTTFGKPGRPEP